MKELLLGCGSRIRKDMFFDKTSEFKNLTTLDINSDHNPDVIWDLTEHPLPFKDNEFDEIHCYDVLEHLAYQGDYKFFFSEFSEYARILKPNGKFFASVPSIGSFWAFGDPSHKRIVHPGNIIFLNQESYSEVGKNQISDFRKIYKANLVLLYKKEDKNKFYFILENKK